MPPLVEIGLTDLSKSGGAIPVPPGTTGLYIVIDIFKLQNLLYLKSSLAAFPKLLTTD